MTKREWIVVLVLTALLVGAILLFDQRFPMSD
jgi:preprotein translocase subunit SecE